MYKEIIGGFVVGSSIIPCAITYAYMLRAYYRLDCPKNVIPFDKFWTISLAFGLFNALNILIQFIFFEWISPFIIAFLIGSLQGLCFSVIGRFVYHFPRKLFQFKKESYVHLIAIPLYGMIYILIVQPLNLLYILR